MLPTRIAANSKASALMAICVDGVKKPVLAPFLLALVSCISISMQDIWLDALLCPQGHSYAKQTNK